MSNQEIESIYSLPGTVSIYMGDFKYVSEHHIEYDFNALTVFLLD
jgi:uncharacterized Fe-S radical SAM superfamily protein PflX